MYSRCTVMYGRCTVMYGRCTVMYGMYGRCTVDLPYIYRTSTVHYRTFPYIYHTLPYIYCTYSLLFIRLHQIFSGTVCVRLAMRHGQARIYARSSLMASSRSMAYIMDSLHYILLRVRVACLRVSVCKVLLCRTGGPPPHKLFTTKT